MAGRPSWRLLLVIELLFLRWRTTRTLGSKADILHILCHNRVGFIATMFKGFIAHILRHNQ
jgi:hypothetical protein